MSLEEKAGFCPVIFINEIDGKEEGRNLDGAGAQSPSAMNLSLSSGIGNH